MDRRWIGDGSRMDRGWIEDGPRMEQPPTPLGKKSHRDGPRKKTTSVFSPGVGLPGMYRSSCESICVGRLLIPTRRGVGGLKDEVRCEEASQTPSGLIFGSIQIDFGRS